MTEQKPTDLTVDDATFEQEVTSNARTIEHPELGELILSRPTRRLQAKINEARRKQWHKDLKDPDILSRDEVEKIAIARGMWSEGLSERILELSRKIGELMGVLDAAGYKSIPELLREYNEVVMDLREEVNEEGQEFIDEYFDFENDARAEIAVKIKNSALSTKADELLDRGNYLRNTIELLRQMGEIRTELDKLRGRQSNLFFETIESRADRAEAVARIYYCVVTKDGERLWESVEEIWDADPEVVDFLETEMFYFLNGLDNEFRDTLQKYGFIHGPISTENELEDSPDQPQSNSDGESAESEPMSSSDIGESENQNSTALEKDSSIG